MNSKLLVSLCMGMMVMMNFCIVRAGEQHDSNGSAGVSSDTVQQKIMLAAHSESAWGKKTFEKQDQNIQKCGWTVEPMTPQALTRGDYPVYFFWDLSNDQAKEYGEVWDILWKKVRKGALLVIQPRFNLNFSLIAKNDKSLFCEGRPIQKIALENRRANFVKGPWVSQPYDIKGFLKYTLTPAYVMIPQRPDKWQILADQPRSEEEPQVRDPYILMRRYGRGDIIMIGPSGINMGHLISNILANREWLRDKSLK